MATYFLRSKHISRSKGSRVTRAAAYRAGERIRDERTSEVYDYSDRDDVAYKEVTLPEELQGRDDMAWTQDRSILWNAAEHAGLTISDVWAIDEHLAQHLRPWPTFRRVIASDSEPRGDFANHCPHCATPQDDLYLHSEPDQPFFDIPNAPPGSIKLTPLACEIQLSGDEHFSLE
jgi:hypothetical protein